MKRDSKYVALGGLLICLAALLVHCRAASAAEAAPPPAKRESVTIATSVVTPFFGTYYLEGKVRASHALALVFNASYLVLENHGWKTKSGTIGVGVDYFFQSDALRRFYLEGIAEAWFASQRHEPSGEVAALGLGYAGVALVGYEFVWEFGLVLDLGAGAVAFRLPSARVEVDGAPVTSEALWRVYPAVKANVGWAF